MGPSEDWSPFNRHVLVIIIKWYEWVYWHIEDLCEIQPKPGYPFMFRWVWNIEFFLCYILYGYKEILISWMEGLRLKDSYIFVLSENYSGDRASNKFLYLMSYHLDSSQVQSFVYAKVDLSFSSSWGQQKQVSPSEDRKNQVNLPSLILL